MTGFRRNLGTPCLLSLRAQMSGIVRSTLAVIGLVVVSACGSSRGHVHSGAASGSTGPPTRVAVPTPTTPPRTRKPRSASTVTPTSTTLMTSPTAVKETIPACRTNDLRPSWAGSVNGASGELLYLVREQNITTRTCRLAGYFGGSVDAPGGNPISATPYKNRRLGNPDVTVSIAPHAYAHFQLGLADVSQERSGNSCTVTVGAVHLIAPNDTVSVSLVTKLYHGHYPPTV
jgi:hypothetical protein